jgi:cytochrome c-type biogenesis protein CcmH/NrfG
MHVGLIGRRWRGALIWGLALTLGGACLFTGCGPKPDRVETPEAEPEHEATLEDQLASAEEYMADGRVGEAAERYEAILMRDPESFEATLNLAVALKTMEDARYLNDRDYGEIRNLLVRAESLEPGDPRPHLLLGTIEFEKGNYGTAIGHLRRADALDAGNSLVHEMLGISLIKTGDPAGGETELREVIRTDPENQAANFHLGKIYEEQGRSVEAAVHLEQALEANPNLDMATYLLSRIYYETKHYVKAEAKCREFLRHHPDDIQSLEILGRIYRQEGRAEEMVDVYGRLAELRPENTLYWSPVVEHYMDAEDYERARGVLEESLTHNPYYAYGNVRYGQVLMHYGDQALRTGRKQESAALYRKAEEHLQRARVDDRYEDAALKLIDMARRRIKKASGS